MIILEDDEQEDVAIHNEIWVKGEKDHIEKVMHLVIKIIEKEEIQVIYERSMKDHAFEIKNQDDEKTNREELIDNLEHDLKHDYD